MRRPTPRVPLRTQARIARMAYVDALGAAAAMCAVLLTGVLFLILGAIWGVAYGRGQLFTQYTLMMAVGLAIAMVGARYIEAVGRELVNARAQYRYYRYTTNKTKENHARMAKAIAKTLVPYPASETAAWRSATDDMHPVR